MKPAFFVATFAAALGVGVAPAQERPTQSLTERVGRDPTQLLHEIGSAPDSKAAKELAKPWREKLDGRTQLGLLRFGLGSDDERIVFGAAVLLGGEQFLYVPEMKKAAARIAPRIGASDCPMTFDQLQSLIGGADIAATGASLRRLSPEDAVSWCGELHRIVRPENIPALCEQALAADGALRNATFSNASLTANYSDTHTTLLLTTWLRMVDREPDPDRDGLPGLLTEVLRACVDLPEEPVPERGELDTRRPWPPITVLARELLRSTPSADDVPLLERFIARSERFPRHAALLAMGKLNDDASLRVLRAYATHEEEDVRLTARVALAERGDARILDELLAGKAEEIAHGLCVASPERRRTFAADLLTLPVEAALERLRRLGNWPRARVYDMPPYADAFVADFESLAAASSSLDACVLRELVDQLPVCATRRIADALLARPANELFAIDDLDSERRGRHGGIGHCGVWAFLEVTRPETFRERLREGLRGADEKGRSLSAVLLARMGDATGLDLVAAQLEGIFYGAKELSQLARTGDPRVVKLLRSRVASGAHEGDAPELMRALAVAAGMPLPCAERWNPKAGDESVRDALLRGDAVDAFLQSIADDESLSWDGTHWPHPTVLAFLADRRSRANESATELSEFDMSTALRSGDRAQIAIYEQFVRDGRYAVQQGLATAHGKDLSTLDLWITDLGTNCCHVPAAETVMEALFGSDAHAFDRSTTAEPAMKRLQRTLLPKRDRLRWSWIANAYVIAGD